MMKTFKCAYVYINIVTERHQFLLLLQASTHWGNSFISQFNKFNL